MAYTDVRDYIEELTRRNLLHVIEDEISKDTELVPLVRLQFRGLPEPERKAFGLRTSLTRVALIMMGQFSSARLAARASYMVQHSVLGLMKLPKNGPARTVTICHRSPLAQKMRQ